MTGDISEGRKVWDLNTGEKNRTTRERTVTSNCVTPKVQYVPAIKVPPLIMSTCFKRGEILRNAIVREKAGQQSENKTRTGMGMAECLPGVWKTLDCLRNKTNKK